jgi:hypothetical protein
MAKYFLGTHYNQQKNERVKDRLSNLQRRRIRPVLCPSLSSGSTEKANTPDVFVVQVIDYMEEIYGDISAYEFKWNPLAKSKFSKTFTETYLPKETKVFHRDNYWEWLKNP